MALPAILSGLGKNLVLSAAKGSKGSSSRSALVRRGDNVDDTKVVKKENYKKYFDSGEKKSSSIIVRPSSSLVSRKSVNIKSFGGDTGLVSIQNKIGNIENVLKESSLFKTKKSNEQKKLQEQNKRKKTEEKLETPEKKNGISLPIPGKGLFDNIMSRLSNFVFWVFIGKLIPAIIDFIPKIEGLLKVIGNIGDTILNIFGSILDSMVGFVSSAFKAWEDVKEIAKNIGGENAEKLLNDLSANFEKFLNLALIAGMLSTDIGDGGKPGKPGTPGKPGKPGRVGPTTSGGRPLGRPDLRNPLRQRPIITRGRGGSPRMPRLPGSGPRITGSGVNQSVTKGALSKVVKRIPIVGALIDFAINYFIFKEPLGRAAFKAVGSSLIGFLGGALGAVAGPPGAIAGGLLGGMAGDALGGMLYDKIFTGKNPPKKSIQTKSRGGQVSNSDRSAQPKRTFTGQTTRRPIIQRPKKSEPGKDVGGENKIKILFPDTEYKNPMDFANARDAAGDPLAGTWEMHKKLNRPNPYKALTSTAKILKDIPVIGGIMGASVDIALGQKVTPETLNSLFSSVDYLVKTSADKGVSNIRSIINGFDRGGNIPGRSLNVGDQNFNANKLSDVIKVSFNQKINQAIKEIQDNISRRPSTGRDEMLQDNQRRAGDGGGGGGGGGSPTSPGGGGGGGQMAATGNEYEKALLNLISEAEGTTASYGVVFGGKINKDLEQGKLTVQQVIDLGNNAKTGSGATGRYQFMPATLSGLIRMGVLKPNEKFTPEMQDKAALALIRGRGVDPSKPLTENDIYRLGGEWASFEGGPKMKKGGSYSYRGRSQVKYKADKALEIYDRKLKSIRESPDDSLTKDIPSITGAEKARYLIVMSGRRGYRQVKSGESAPSDYLHHGDEDIRGGLLVRDYGITPQVHGGSQMLEGEGAPLVVPFGMKAKAIVEGRHAIRFEDPKTGKILARYHHLENIPSGINGKVLNGGSFIGNQGGRPGASSAYGSSTAVHTHLEGTPEWHRAFINTYAEGLRITKDSQQPSKRDYDVIIPLDHHKGKLPDPRLWPKEQGGASLGASGRERDAQEPTAHIIKQRLEAKGLKVLIMKPEDYRDARSYNNDLRKYGQGGSVVLSTHYDAPSNMGGTGFLSRLGNSSNREDREYAKKLEPILQRMSREAGGNQRYGGIDTVGNATMTHGGANTTAALIELGALVEQEKRYGKQFWKNPEFIKHLNDIADVTAGSVKRPTQQNKPNAAKPVARDLVSVQNKIRDMKPGDPPVTIPGVGKVVIKKNKHGTIIKEYYDSNNRPIDSGKFFDLVKGPSKPSTPTAAKPSTPSAAKPATPLGPAPPAPVLPPPPSYAQPAARQTPRGRWGAANKKYGGGLIGSPNLNRSNVGSFASYEHPGVRTNIIFVPVPVNSGSMSPAINKSTGNVAPEKSSLNGMVGGMSKIHQLSRS